MRVGPSGEEGGRATSGVGYTWCYRCGRVEEYTYVGREVPWGHKAGRLGNRQGIGLISCGECRRGHRQRYGSEQEHNRAIIASFCAVEIRRCWLGGREAIALAKARMGEDLEFVTKEEDLAFLEVSEILEGQMGEDNVVSMNMARVRSRPVRVNRRARHRWTLRGPGVNQVRIVR